MKHKQTVYLVRDEKGDLNTVQYAPTMSYSGRKDSDQYAMMQGLFIKDVDHTLWIGEVECYRNVAASWGIHTQDNIKCKIVAKKTFMWDMDKPRNERMSEVQQTSNFDSLFKQVHGLYNPKPVK